MGKKVITTYETQIKKTPIMPAFMDMELGTTRLVQGVPKTTESPFILPSASAPKLEWGDSYLPSQPPGPVPENPNYLFIERGRGVWDLLTAEEQTSEIIDMAFNFLAGVVLHPNDPDSYLPGPSPITNLYEVYLKNFIPKQRYLNAIRSWMTSSLNLYQLLRAVFAAMLYMYNKYGTRWAWDDDNINHTPQCRMCFALLGGSMHEALSELYRIKRNISTITSKSVMNNWKYIGVETPWSFEPLGFTEIPIIMIVCFYKRRIYLDNPWPTDWSYREILVYYDFIDNIWQIDEL